MTSQAFTHSNRFSCLDPGHRVKWYDQTGLEQYEWYRAWRNVLFTHTRMAAETAGLNGTDPSRLTVATIGEALQRSPSLANRRPPVNIIPLNDFNNAMNALGVVPTNRSLNFEN